MLTIHETATIRAALRYWIDEIVPQDESVARLYLDSTEVRTLNRLEVEFLIDCLDETNLRFVAVETERLILRHEAVERQAYSTVILSR